MKLYWYIDNHAILAAILKLENVIQGQILWYGFLTVRYVIVDPENLCKDVFEEVWMGRYEIMLIIGKSKRFWWPFWI